MPKTDKSAADFRRAYRKNVKLLVGFHCYAPNAPIPDGFARAVSLSETGAMLELPDLYQVGNEFDLEFLFDNDFIAPLKGKIVRIDKRKEMYETAIEFAKVPAKIKRLIEDQIKE